MNFDQIKLTHVIVVNIFLLSYLVKTILLLFNKKPSLAKFTKVFKVPDMVISFAFLVTGVWMIVLLGTVQPMLIVKIVMVLASIPIAVIAFKKHNKIMAIITMLLIIGAYGIGEMSKVPKVWKTPESATVSGADLYLHNCQNCHGPKGDLANNGSKDLSQSTIDHATILSLLANGKNLMPSYGKLTDAEREAVAVYAEGLRQAK
ncbi:MAG: SirB2 family protein [Bacteroidota bacterium]